MTVEQYEASTRAIFSEYITPIYQIIGAGVAFCILAFCIILIVAPFIRRT